MGQPKMRALASAIKRSNNKCAWARGSIVFGPVLVMEHIDAVVNALDDALVAIRTLDYEIFEASDRTAYASAGDRTRLGKFV